MSHDLPYVELADLPRWMKAAEPPQRDAVLTALFVIAATDRRAYIALAWLLMPGAAKQAGCIHRGRSQLTRPSPASCGFSCVSTIRPTTPTWRRRSSTVFTESP
ncbi:hypothetical protein NKG05_25920 [Oerskovia sp. M15]